MTTHLPEYSMSALLVHFQTMLAYEAHATGLALQSLRAAPDQTRPEFARACGIMGHIQMARHEWLARLGAIQRRTWDMFPAWTVAEIAADAQRLDDAWRLYFASLNESDLATVIRYSSLDGRGFESTVADVLTHAFNHSTYHRGQVALLVVQCGGQSAPTDHILLTRRVMPAASAGKG